MEEKRKQFVQKHICAVTKNNKIIDAFKKTPRELFVPEDQKIYAYEDKALPIGQGQTISQPSLVAIMTDALNLQGNEKVLEIGTGSAFQAAILARLAKEVYTVEIIKPLAEHAKKTLSKLNLTNVNVFHANGTIGLPNYAPFDAIIVTAGAKKIPQPLVNQLKDGGLIVIPQGDTLNTLSLKVAKKKGSELTIEEKELVQFVPLKGKHGSFTKN